MPRAGDRTLNCDWPSCRGQIKSILVPLGDESFYATTYPSFSYRKGKRNRFLARPGVLLLLFKLPGSPL
ncbi:hypothetical protein JTE90_000631 [Oedothorax gibbosus]|uniref:Uncharacterized protein n=1 Tax=Oedothorax gibbosus TaxID=931172 RepID=A0AAV6VWS9_9ARAC|nr:hypothetical protein JTE90_000631 [Oedothorax gibbosus]